MKLTSRSAATVSALIAASILAACAPQASPQLSSNDIHTGDAATEGQTAGLTASQQKSGFQAYVSAEFVNVRTAPEVSPSTLAGGLERNDKVEIVDGALIGPEKFIAIRVLETNTGVAKGQILYIAERYLSGEQVKLEGDQAAASKLFVVTNIATEKVRVYQRCEPTEGCVNKMIFEQDVVAGNDNAENRTDVGVYRIDKWEKFYESGPYAAWYRPGYLPVPSQGSRQAWFDTEYMPGRKTAMRGAFGWYTIKVSPNPNGQWMHGTAGWGKDKKDFIMFKDSFLGGIVSLFTNIGSHGCTRIDNESIAYLRQILPVGTPYIKIYAKEAIRGSTPMSYFPAKASWNYIMTKNGYGTTGNHERADRNEVLANGTPRSQWIEEGTFIADQHPDAASGDVYDIGSRNFRGVFVVDEGTTVDYSHPSKLAVGGNPSRGLPSFMISNNRSFNESSKSSSTSSSSSGGSSSSGWNSGTHMR